MKIKKSLTNKVKESIGGCRNTLVWAIIELCQQIDTKETGRIAFEHPFMLSVTRNTKSDRDCRFTTEHMVVTHIVYGPMDRMDKTFVLEYENVGQTSSFWLSLGDLLKVYEELKKTVLHE